MKRLVTAASWITGVAAKSALQTQASVQRSPSPPRTKRTYKVCNKGGRGVEVLWFVYSFVFLNLFLSALVPSYPTVLKAEKTGDKRYKTPAGAQSFMALVTSRSLVRWEFCLACAERATNWRDRPAELCWNMLYCLVIVQREARRTCFCVPCRINFEKSDFLADWREIGSVYFIFFTFLYILAFLDSQLWIACLITVFRNLHLCVAFIGNVSKNSTRDLALLDCTEDTVFLPIDVRGPKAPWRISRTAALPDLHFWDELYKSKQEATSNKCIATSNKCLTSSNKKLLVAGALLVAPGLTTSNKKLY